MSLSDSSTPLLDPAVPSNIMLHPTKTRRIYSLILLLVLVHLANVLYTLPINRVIEMRLCREHYAADPTTPIKPRESIPEKMCKIDDIQRNLAWLQGVMETTLVVCGRKIIVAQVV